MDREENIRKLTVDLFKVLESYRRGNEIPGAIEAIGIILRNFILKVNGKDGHIDKETARMAQNDVIRFITAAMREGLVDEKE